MGEVEKHIWRIHTPERSIPLVTDLATTECLPCLLDLLPVRDVPLNDQIEELAISSIRCQTKQNKRAEAM
jgi:hypothetical protein